MKNPDPEFPEFRKIQLFYLGTIFKLDGDGLVREFHQKSCQLHLLATFKICLNRLIPKNSLKLELFLNFQYLVNRISLSDRFRHQFATGKEN